MGRSFSLWIGVTLACFQIFGTLPELKRGILKKSEREVKRVAEQVL